MTARIIVIFLLSGLSVSYELIKSSKKSVREAKELFGTASLIEERIRYTRAPLVSILSGIGGKDGDDALRELSQSTDPEVVRLVEIICTSDYEEALSGAVLLKSHTEKEMRSAVEKGERERRARLILPPCISLLCALLLI